MSKDEQNMIDILDRALDPPIREALLEELVRNLLVPPEPVSFAKWFRSHYVTWLPNVPICKLCKVPMKFTLFVFKEAYTFEPDAKNWTGYQQIESNDSFCDRVERYVCGRCHTVEFSGRENDVLVLIRKRQGRCGELAILFTSFCIALGWHARLLFTKDDDHLWTEVEVAGKWIPLDPSAEDTERLIKDRFLFQKWGWKFKDVFALEPGKLPMNVGETYRQ